MVTVNNQINNTVGATNSGVTNTLTVTNPSNTASSQALVNVTVGGASAGDALTTYTVNGVTNWSQGIDNSSTDNFTICASTALGTNNTLVIDTAGNSTFTSTGTSATLTNWTRNLDTNSASNAINLTSVAGGSAADPYLQVAIEATTVYCWGIDNSDSDSLKIVTNSNAATATPSGTTLIWKMSASGERTIPLQPSFLAYQSANVNNVTGNGAAYSLGSSAVMTELFDPGSNFLVGSGVGTGATFTAPVTGKYFFCGSVGLTGNTINTTITCTIGTTGGNFFNTFRRVAAATDVQCQCSTFCSMTSGDIAFIQVTATGEGANSDDLIGSASPYGTYFSGYLVC